MKFDFNLFREFPKEKASWQKPKTGTIFPDFFSNKTFTPALTFISAETVALEKRLQNKCSQKLLVKFILKFKMI